MAARAERKTILVVEDNKDELMIYSTLLSFRGYAILAAASWDDAISVARAQQPDLAVIDISLNDPQDRDGCDLVSAMRADARTKDIPVIAHTAFGDVYRDSLERAGCASIIHKPSSPSVLLDAIEELIGPGTESPDYRRGEGELSTERARQRGSSAATQRSTDSGSPSPAELPAEDGGSAEGDTPDAT